MDQHKDDISTSKAAVINVANKLEASVVDKKEMRVRSSGMSGLMMWW